MKPTEAELELIEKLTACGEAYAKLPVVVSKEHAEVSLSHFGTAINRLQDLVASRTVWRAMKSGEIKK